jgi:L-2,4-diaminobutyrate decarboxylase
MKVFAAETVHYSVTRALHVLGLGAEALVRVPIRADLSMDVAALDRSIAAARDAGDLPMAVVATAGHTSTGAFDDLKACAKVCEEYGVWLHVDAAHGGAFLLAPELRERLDGVEKADSFVWDPHKCLWVPAGCSIVLIRERRKLRAPMAVGLSSAPYIAGKSVDQTLSEEPRDLIALGLACTRHLSAIRLYASLLVYGRRQLGERLVRTCDTTRLLHRMVEQSQDFEALAPPAANILCFRHIPGPNMATEALNSHNRGVREQLAAETSGFYLSGTVVGDRYWLRAVILNPKTSSKHLHELLNRLRVISATPSSE